MTSWRPPTTLERFLATLDLQTRECVEWTGYRGGSDGYGVSLTVGPGRRMLRTYVHRAVWEHFYGPIPEGMQVCHRCDNPPCCNPLHLWVGSHAENLHDRDRKGPKRLRGRLLRRE